MSEAELGKLEVALEGAIANGDVERVLKLEAALDAADAERTRPDLGRSAMWYARRGLYVFPLRPASKLPRSGFHWREEATTDPGTIAQWWEWYPDSNIAIATGHRVDVIDVDGPEGVAEWLAMTDAPPTLGKVSTPRPGGIHLYVAATGDGNRTGIKPGVDYRGLGGYVVAPPSATDVGAYVWLGAPGLGELGQLEGAAT